MLTRLGNKKTIAAELYQYFPPHRVRIYLFIGAAGLHLNTPLAKFNILNDLDDNVTNLYLVVVHQRDELKAAIAQMPMSASLCKHWVNNEETDPVLKAVRFLMLSNFTYMGKGNTFRFGPNLTRDNILKQIEPTFERLRNCQIMNEDFREVLSKISFYPTVMKREESFIYLDPCYLDREHTYKVPKWTKDDTLACFDIMENEGIPAAMSEFDHPFVMEEARRRNFPIIPIKRRRNLTSRKDNEILITNYWPQSLLF